MTHQFTFEGQSRTIFTKADKPCAPWYMKLKKAGKQEWIHLKTHVKAAAEQNAKDILRQRRGQDHQKTRDFFRQKQPQNLTTLKQVVDALMEFAGGASVQTRRDYRWSLQRMVETVEGKAKPWDSHPVEILKEDFVYNYRLAVQKELEEEDADDLQAQRTMRACNSILRQARAAFNPVMLEYYRLTAKLELPDLTAFRTAPGFRGVAKKDWQRPADDLIQQTLKELEATRETHPNRYKACWLALGFGLRKGEIAAARTDWLVEIGGRVHLELRSVIQKDGTESPVTKNGQAAPRIPVANGAWDKLKEVKDWPGAYFIAGGKQYRTDDVFRETNAWLRELGWETQKGIHELRAFAGCQIINQDGIYAASQWLRHGEIGTTQKFYGRYASPQITDAPLKILAGGAPGATVAIYPVSTPAPCHKNQSTRLTPTVLVSVGESVSPLQTLENKEDANVTR